MAMRLDRSRLATAAYVVGPVAILAAAVKYVLTPQFDLWVQLGLALGVLCLAGAVLLDPDRWRQAIAGRQARYGSNALVLSLAVVGILAVLNVLAYNNPQRIDLTEDREYTLSPETLLLLEELGQPVSIIGFYTPENSQSRERMRPLLDEYGIASGGMVSFEFVDPRANPLAADQYGITRDGSMAVVMGEASQVIEFPSERELTSAMIRLANPESRIVYFLEGHGERVLDGTDETGLSQLKSTLENKNYSLASLNLLVEGKVPEDALVLIDAGPSAAWSAEEVELLVGYLEQGGSLLVLHDPIVSQGSQSQADPLESYLATEWGVRLRQDLVVDPASIHALIALSASYGTHAITERMHSLATLYPAARSIELTQLDDPGARTYTPLVETSDSSWGEIELQAIMDGSAPRLDPERDTAGPLNVAVAVQDSLGGARLVVFGDSDFAANSDFFNSGNGDMMVNSVDWAARQEQLISITPRQTTQRTVVPGSRQTVALLVLLTLVVIPGGVVAAGVSVWWSRRKRS